MATGYEDWVRYRIVSPSLALDRLTMHIQGLQEIASGARVQSDGVIYDPQTVVNMLAASSWLMRELDRLSAVVYRTGVPRLVPTRRVDGGNIDPGNPAFGGA